MSHSLTLSTFFLPDIDDDEEDNNEDDFGKENNLQSDALGSSR